PEDRIGLFHAFAIPAVDYLRALRIRRLGGRQLDTLLTPFDAIVAPTHLSVAPPIDQPFKPFFDRHQGPRLGAAGNLCGLPSITVPNGFGERGLPTGIEFMGRAWGEERLVAAAMALQARTEWHERKAEGGRREA
ncbi:MAG: amidase family protein, partial [Dehalococcoidia bacterium]